MWTRWRAALCKTSPNETSWSVLNGACYFVSQQRTSWQRARQFCVEKGAELCSVRDGSENNYVQRIVRPPVQRTTYVLEQ